jgi:peptidoglycan LD-endopeptidase CwlK
MASRLVADLVPELQSLYYLFEKEMHKESQEFILTCTYRSPEEQKELYAQGRTKPGKKVTWTLNSKHNERKAFDIAMLINGKISWNTADYLKAGAIGQKVGLEWGGSWTKTKDYPHFQI